MANKLFLPDLLICWEKTLVKSWKSSINKALSVNLDTLDPSFVIPYQKSDLIENLEKCLFDQSPTVFHDYIVKNIFCEPMINVCKYLIYSKLSVYRNNLLPYAATGYTITPVLYNGEKINLYRVNISQHITGAIFAVIPDNIDGIGAIIPNCNEKSINKFFFTNIYRTLEIESRIYTAPIRIIPTSYVMGNYTKDGWEVKSLPYKVRKDTVNLIFLSSLTENRQMHKIDLLEHRKGVVPFLQKYEEYSPKLPYRFDFVSNLETLKGWGHRAGWPSVLHHINTLSSQDGIPLHFVDIIEDIFSWRVLDIEKHPIKHVFFDGKGYSVPWSNVKIKKYPHGERHVAKLHTGVIVNFDGGWTTKNSPSEEEYLSLTEIKNQKLSIPWIGVLHNPQNMPKWFDYCNAPEEILKRKYFQDSLKTCQGIIVLSNYLADWLGPELTKITDRTIPVISLIHPTEIPEIKFDLDKFMTNSNKLLIQVGYWLRLRTAINHISGRQDGREIYKKLWLYGAKHALDSLDVEAKAEGTSAEFTDVYIERVDNHVYDKLFSQNLIFLNILASSANNAIVECMARNTPVVVNRHPAIVEYLGADYPLFYDTMEQAQDLIFDYERIALAHHYMVNNKLSEKVMFTNFVDSFYKAIQENILVDNVLAIR